MAFDPLPISERVAQAIQTAVAAITIAGGFQIDIVDCIRPDKDGSNYSPKHLRALLFQEDPNPLDEEVDQGDKDWDHIFQVAVYIAPAKDDTTPHDQWVNVVRADIEKKLMEDITFGGLAIEAHIGKPDTRTTSKGTFIIPFINIAVIYRTREDDPYTQ